LIKEIIPQHHLLISIAEKTFKYFADCPDCNKGPDYYYRAKQRYKKGSADAELTAMIEKIDKQDYRKNN
jgi:hypothetical protein